MSGTSPDVPPADARILVIDDEAVVCLSCTRILQPEGYLVDTRQNPEEGVRAALTTEYDVILLDMVMPRIDGLEVLRRLRSAGVASEVVIVTGYSSVPNAVSAMREGAADYVSKPFTPDELKAAVERALARSGRRTVAATDGGDGAFEGLLGASRAMEQVFRTIRRVAPTDATVLITGESGTGKELVARALHRLGTRADRPFLACDCSALAPTLLESELFGHLKGSFSGAVSTKQGLFEVAHRGTLFLDEVSNISLEIQSKLLRALETRRVRRVGDTAEREIDIRLVAATNRDLAGMVAERTFREDLFYRLNVVPLPVPPLREREGDVPRLAAAFLERYRQHDSCTARCFAPETLARLEAYAWPGNVRELRNMVERLAVLCEDERIEPRHLPAALRQPSTGARMVVQLPETWEEFKALKRRASAAVIEDLERRFLLEALARADGNITRTAESVGMQRTNLHALLRKHGLTQDDA
jgi:DNA-binding NtrC family response regulator